jgi:kinesin family protein C1
MTDAAANTRGAMGPPSTGGHKHKPSGRKMVVNNKSERPLTPAVPESDAKHRRTLIERAGEPAGSKIAGPPNSRLGLGASKHSAASAGQNMSASTSRLPSNKPSKHASAKAFGNTVGHGARAASANVYNARPKSSFAHNRSKSHYQAARPATSMAQHEDDKLDHKGVPPFLISTNPSESLKVPKKVARSANHRLCNSVNVTPTRAFHNPISRSISSPSPSFPTSPIPEDPDHADANELLTGFGALSLNASNPKTRGRHMGYGFPSGKHADIPLKSKVISSKSNITSSKSNITSSIPRFSPRKQPMGPPPKPAVQTPTRPPTPQETPFLNRFTNVRAPVYDEARVSSLEAQFTAFKERIETDMTKQNTLQDSIKLYETKSASFSSMDDRLHQLLT